MKFKRKHIPEPKPGDTKIVSKFAWLPTRVNNYTVWIGWYEQLYIYQVQQIRGIYNGQAASFTVNNWLKVSERA